LWRVTFRITDEQALERFVHETPRHIERNEAGLAEVQEDLLALLAGTRQQMRMQFDLGDMRPFQKRVLEETQRIDRGQVLTYGDIALRVGLPGAAQAVGQALGHNPLPIVIPCHRVIAAQGDLGGFTGGRATKIDLLTLEGVSLAENQPRLGLQ
jgi:methylated-DNA-[protein]-cysteine S-methyltransferase